MIHKTFVRPFFLLLFVSLLSCSSDDNDSSSEASHPYHVKKIVESVYFESVPEILTTEFIYEGSLLKRIITGSRNTEVIYADDQVAYLKSYQNEVLVSQDGFAYQDGKLIAVNGDEFRTLFSYQQNQLSQKKVQILSGGSWVDFEVADFTFNSAGNASQVLRTSSIDDMIYLSRTAYGYDDKSNPFQNMNKYLRMVWTIEGMLTYTANNINSQVVYSPPSSTTGAEYLINITYNENNLPKLIERRFADGNLISSSSIEYIIP